jgi:hypothetical protein
MICNTVRIQFDFVEWDEIQENNGCCKPKWSTALWITEFAKHCVFEMTTNDSVWITFKFQFVGLCPHSTDCSYWIYYVVPLQ